MVTVTYPGVYIEELPSAVHTITGVATSIAAFVGWSPQGPTDVATLVESWPDYQRTFGGLDVRSNLGYAVNQFFTNGGQQAYIVRLVSDGTGGTSKAELATAKLLELSSATFLSLHAANPGSWAQHYGMIAKASSSAFPNRFSILVTYTPDLTVKTAYSIVESFQSLSLDPTDPRYVVNIINGQSSYIQFEGTDLPLTFTSPYTLPALATVATPPVPVLFGAGLSASTLDGTVLAPDALYPADPSPPSAAAIADFLTTLEASGGTGGVNLLTRVPIFNLLCVPGLSDPTTIGDLQMFCLNNRAFMIVDCDQNDSWKKFTSAPPGPNSLMTGSAAINSAFYFPWVNAPDSLNLNRIRPYPPCGFVAGLYAATDSSRGVWKAPAGIAASLTGVSGLTTILTDAENGDLNPLAINCLRNFNVFGNVIWGSRTLRGNDEAASDYKYVPIKRLALFLESSLYNGTQWVVFEPNDETLWGQIRLNVGAFMQGLFLQGAFAGTTSQQAYFVKCDGENNPPTSVAMGMVNVLVGFAPLYPAEFVVIQIQQIVAGS